MQAVRIKIMKEDGRTMHYSKGVTDPDCCVLRFTAVSGRFYSNFKLESFEIEDGLSDQEWPQAAAAAL